MDKWYPIYDKITIGVVVEYPEEREMYHNLFRFILKDNIINEYSSKDVSLIETDKIRLDIRPKTHSVRGWRRHYILNLTQDIEFDEMCVKPKTIMFDYLRNDPKWEELFN